MTSRYQGRRHVTKVAVTFVWTNGHQHRPTMVESMGCRVVPESNHVQESHTCLFFFRLFFRPLQDHGFVEIQKFSTMAT